MMLSVLANRYALVTLRRLPVHSSTLLLPHALRLGWVVCIAIRVWGSFVRDWPEDDDDAQRRLLYLFGGSVGTSSLIIALIPLIGDHYGDSGGWCWIDNSDTGHALRYITFYVS